MTIDLIYATNSSGTHEAAQVVAATLTQAGHTVNVQSAQSVSPAKIGKANLTILGSCTWERFVDGKRLEGELQLHMFALVQKLKQRKLAGKQFAIFALGDSGYTQFANAAAHLEEFVQSVKAKQVGASLRIDGWFFNLQENRKRIVDWSQSLLSA